MSTKHWTKEPPWFEHAKDLKPGGSVRVGDSFKISFNGFAYHLYDFRDKISERYQPTLSLAEKLELAKAKREAESAALQSVDPPKDCQYHPRDWPAQARIWFYSSGLNDDDLLRLGYCWAPTMQRVVMPFKTLAGHRSYVARDPWWTRKSGGPKYLRPPASPGAGLVGGFSMTHAVLTEDLVSAVRISAVTGVDTVPLMGTSLSRMDSVRLVKRYKHLLLWLDPDGAGGMGQMAVRKVLGSFDIGISGFNRWGSIDKVDPKKLPDDVIGDVIAGWLHG